MSQQSKAQGTNGRALALARRKALSVAGKTAEKSSAPSRTRGDTVVRRAPAVLQPRVATAVRSIAEPIAPAPPVTASALRPRQTVRPAASQGPGRSAALARRQAMSARGKVAMGANDPVREDMRNEPAVEASPAKETAGREDCSCGRTRDGEDRQASLSRTLGASRSGTNNRPKVRGPRRNDALANPGRAASLARRQAQSSRGKAGMSANGMTAAQTARATNPDLTGRELAKALREQRSRRGGAGQKRSAPAGRSRTARASAPQGAARDAPWKVGTSQTSQGQTVTGTMVGRARGVTGDEASTCRTVTGTEYMGADIFRDFCQSEPPKSVKRGGLSPTGGGNTVTGNEVGRSTKVTGDEPGTCQYVTGTEYMGANLREAFCGIRPEQGPSKNRSAENGSETRGGERVTGNRIGRSGKVTGDEAGANRALTGTQYMQLGEPAAIPTKVGRSLTLSGGAVTGTMVGRHQAMTGDEAGSCRNVTGDDYIGQEQYGGFCDAIPTRKERKVGISATLGGERITGTMTGRGSRVTGDEPGTCKAITGTPYVGVEQYGSFCEPTQAGRVAARMQPNKRMHGSAMTGSQPGVGGKTTGDGKGACELVTGTRYVGADQIALACPAAPAEPGSPDFPQALPGSDGKEPWSDFSVEPPAHASKAPKQVTGVTGAFAEGGRITGPFGMANGKVTGTDEARFPRLGSNPAEATAPAEQPSVNGRVKSRITGEGISAGLKITGDDWDRGDRVTGTEGTSSVARNPSQRGPTVPMAAAFRAKGRPEDVPEPVSKVTGSSGNTEKGALVTYSGGARG